MFLSSRWGKPSYEIEQIPASEFLRQKRFWEVSPWGLCDDVIAQFASWYLQSKTTTKSSNAYEIKQISAFSGTLKKFVVESASTLRKQFMGLARAINQKGK